MWERHTSHDDTLWGKAQEGAGSKVCNCVGTQCLARISHKPMDRDRPVTPRVTSPVKPYRLLTRAREIAFLAFGSDTTSADSSVHMSSSSGTVSRPGTSRLVENGCG